MAEARHATSSQSVTLARLGVVAAAVLFSTGGAAIKSCTLSGPQVACFRSGVAALTLLLLVPQARRGYGPRTVVVGAAYAATVITFVMATKLTTAANAIFLQSVAPLYLLLLGPWLLREPLRRQDLVFGGPIVLGLVLLLHAVSSPARTAPDPARGDLIGVGSSVAWALTLSGLRWLGRRSPSGTNPALPAVVLGNIEACVLCLPWALPIDAGAVVPADLAAIGYLGAVQIGLAYVFLTRSMRRVPVLEASLLLFVEPVLNPVWAWLVHGERPGVLALVGGAVILGATAAHTVTRSRPTAQPSPD
jgi:drug/metabolite transporter (DMT)-like permease